MDQVAETKTVKHKRPRTLKAANDVIDDMYQALAEMTRQLGVRSETVVAQADHIKTLEASLTDTREQLKRARDNLDRHELIREELLERSVSAERKLERAWGFIEALKGEARPGESKGLMDRRGTNGEHLPDMASDGRSGVFARPHFADERRL